MEMKGDYLIALSITLTSKTVTALKLQELSVLFQVKKIVNNFTMHAVLKLGFFLRCDLYSFWV